MLDVVNVCAPNCLDPYDSYGLLALELARRLTRSGVYVNLFAIGEREFDTQDDELAAIVSQPVRPATGAIMLGYPTGFHKHQNPLSQMGRHVAITMFESSKLPKGWVDVLNRCDAVIVPTCFCQEVFLDSGVEAPVHVIPLGIGDRYGRRPEPVRLNEGRPLTYLAFLDRGMRKGGIYALQAFMRAFGEDTDYRLLLKSRAAELRLDIVNPNVQVIQEDMTEGEMCTLFQSTDVLVDANMGEGFGMIGRQFAATGGVTLSTNWGGTADDIERWAWPLPYELVKADWRGNKILEGQDVGVWAKPAVDGVAHMMRWIADDLDRFGEVAFARAADVTHMCNWDDFGDGVLELWQGVNVGNRIAV